MFPKRLADEQKLDELREYFLHWLRGYYGRTSKMKEIGKAVCSEW